MEVTAKLKCQDRAIILFAGAVSTEHDLRTCCHIGISVK